MGNSSSAPSSRPTGNNSQRLDSSSPTTPTSSITNHVPHHSLRAKKKSLELPDLASLALTPSHHQPDRHHPTPPIPIPNVNPSHRGRSPPQLPSTTDVYIPQPSTHIPMPPPVNAARHRGNPHIRGAPLPYSSTHSFTTRGYQQYPRHHQQQRGRLPPFIPETVHSTIPIALTKMNKDIAGDGKLVKSGIPGDDSREPVSVRIIWRGAAKSVVLARAGDDNWKGRRPLEREDPSSDEVWFTRVSLAPGTHHFRFLVDDQWCVADDLPTAVDDEGSLANYVGVALSTPMTATTYQPTPPKLRPGQSFWSTSSSTGDGPTSDDRKLGPACWTSEFPMELIAAAKEEENYLTSSSSVGESGSGIPAPNIPPAPALPRFLDKLILNVKTTAVVPTPQRSRDRDREDKKAVSRKLKPSLGMTGTATVDANGSADAGSRSADTPASTRLYALGLADDTSVLPVPSHVVLQHLCTSAIRNGVLAVANTTRYRKKYLTTIYYKPT